MNGKSAILPGMDVIEVTPENEAKRDRLGRKVICPAERERLLDAYEGCGLTQKEFCQREGVNYHTFVSWLGHRRKGSVQRGSQLVEMVVPFGGNTVPMPFELDLGQGIVVRTADEAALWRLIERARAK